MDLSQSFAMLREFIQAQEGAKALPYRVELTDAGGPLYSGGAPASYNDYNGFNAGARVRTPLQKRSARIHMQTYGGSQAIDWLADAVDFTSTAAGAAGYHFEDEGGNKFVVQRHPADSADVKDAPLLAAKLFAEPNPYMNWSELCEVTLIDYLIVGDAYWVKWQANADGQPLALYRMAPDCVKIVPGPFGPEEYRYRLPGAREDVTFTPDEVIHFRRTNPNDPYYGQGIVQAGARALDMELALTSTMAHYYEQRALPSGVVETERRVPRDVFQKLKAQLRNFYSGGDNAGKLMVLENGLKFSAISASASNAMFKEMSMWSRDRILAMFHLNKGLLGIHDAEGDPSLADWQLLFDQKTMIPLCRRFSTAISRGLTTPAWGLKFVIDYEETLPPEQVVAHAQQIAQLPGVLVKEVRAAAKLPPSTGDEAVDNMPLNMPGSNMDATGQGGTADPNLAGEPGRPPVAANTRSFPKSGSTKQAPPQRKTTGKPTKQNQKSLSDIVADMDTQIALLRAKPVRDPNLEALEFDVSRELEEATQAALGSKADEDGLIDKVGGIISSGAEAAAAVANLKGSKIDYDVIGQKALLAPNTLNTLKEQLLDKPFTEALTDWQAEIPGVARAVVDFGYAG